MQVSRRQLLKLSAGTIAGAVLANGPNLEAHEMEHALPEKLKGFDRYMAQLLNEWNAPGVGVGIVLGDQLVFAKGFGYRDYEKRLPFTSTTLCPIASNSKLFTAVAAGLLVSDRQLAWDRPIRDAVPSLRFYNDTLNNTVTLRDMLAHRTGISRHDRIWYTSNFSRKELFERVQYLAPKESLRQTYLYNNLMYAAVGYIIEVQTGKTWEEIVRERILAPLKMSHTVFSIANMLKQPEYVVPFTERRDTSELAKLPYYEQTEGIAPAGAIIANIEDASRWLIALMNDGAYRGQQVLPSQVLKATLEPAIAIPNVLGETMGFWEVMHTAHGMGRNIGSYRGHLLTDHGGALGGFHSQISYLPLDHIGVLVFTIGNHCAQLPNIISYAVYERLLSMDHTPWSERWLEVKRKNKKAGMEARSHADAGRVSNTHPSHTLTGYVGEYEHAAYGRLKIELKGEELELTFHEVQLPLTHFHYDRFDTRDDEIYGKWSINFRTNPQGDIDQAVMTLDDADVIFTRKPEALAFERLQRLTGIYEAPGGTRWQVILRDRDRLYVVSPGEPDDQLVYYKDLQFRIEKESGVIIEFVEEGGQITALKLRDPSGEYLFSRK